MIFLSVLVAISTYELSQNCMCFDLQYVTDRKLVSTK